MSDTSLFISLLTIELLIPWAQSLKDKRRAVRGLKERLRSRFNASVSEVALHDKWQRAMIAVCIVDSDRRRLDSVRRPQRPKTSRSPECTRSGCNQIQAAGAHLPTGRKLSRTAFRLLGAPVQASAGSLLNRSET
jgi:uncharacterized protein YlxP (DUF503 family)